jgi:hypothetical protein
MVGYSTSRVSNTTPDARVVASGTSITRIIGRGDSQSDQRVAVTLKPIGVADAFMRSSYVTISLTSVQR